jgi:hypothetical protein
MEILAFSGTWPPLNGVQGCVPGLGTRSHFRTLLAQKSLLGVHLQLTAAFTIATEWIAETPHRVFCLHQRSVMRVRSIYEITYSGFCEPSRAVRITLILLVGAGRFERPTPCAQGGYGDFEKIPCFQGVVFQ